MHVRCVAACSTTRSRRCDPATPPTDPASGVSAAPHGHPSALRVVAATTASTTQVMLPVLLIGGTAALIRADLPAFDEARVGVTVSTFFAATAVASIPGGRLSEAWGPRRGLIVGTLAASAAMLLFAVSPYAWGLIVASVLAGVANGTAQPASNLGLARGVRGARQGTAFGIKQAAVPLSGLMAGLSVPLVAEVFGWRVTFVLAAAIAVPVVLLIPRRFTASPAPRRDAGARYGGGQDAPRTALWSLSAAAGCGSAAANTLGAFLVLTVIAGGGSGGLGGYLLALGGATGIVTRLLAGWQADRRGSRHLGVVAGMLAVGTLAYVILALQPSAPLILALATVIGFAAGWGWPGLMILTVVRLHPNSPGAASAVLGAGAAVGGVSGPLVFGLIVRAAGYPAAWLFSAGLALLGLSLVLNGRRIVRRAIADGRYSSP